MNHELTVQGYPVYRTGYVRKDQVAVIAVKQALAASQEAPDYWLRVIVARYLEKFYRDRKNGHPPAEELSYAIDSWVEDIGYNLTQEQDAERVIRGFMLLSRSITRWPQPAELLKCLPGRKILPPQPSPSWGGNNLLPPAGGGREGVASTALQDILDMIDQKEQEARNGA
jgi:hypothetical protein